MQAIFSNRKNRIIIDVLCILIIVLIIFILAKGPKEYEVFFNTDGGSKVESLKVVANATVAMPDNPTKEGYIFEGWYYENEAFNFDREIDKDIVLVAKWKEENTVGLSLDIKNLALLVDEEAQINVNIYKKEINASDLEWSSSDEEVVTVSNTGVVKALKNGIAIVTVKTKDGKYRSMCEVSVLENIIKLETVAIEGPSDVKVGETIKLNAIITPEDATNKSVEWKTSSKTVAVVDQEGNVTGVKSGNVIITVTTDDGKQNASFIVNVYDDYVAPVIPEEPVEETPPEPPEVLVEELVIEGPKEVKEGEQIKLNVIVKPDNATNINIVWISGSEDIAKVDNEGNVTGIKSGDCEIIVINGSIITRYNIKVLPKEQVPDPIEDEEEKGVLQHLVGSKK